MIIRSLSRKSPSFRQLLHYMNRDDSLPYFISWNLNLSNHRDYERVLSQFYENAQLLKPGKKSMKLQSGVSLDRQMKALHDVSQKYIQVRGTNLLSYGRMHLDEKSVHMHVMFSANELNKANRHRLSQAQFAMIQRQCEQYLRQAYPDLKQAVLYDRERTQKPNRSRQREYEYTKRTGKKTRKQEVKEKLQELFGQERKGTLSERLRQHEFELYQRGKHYGVIHKGMKYRLGTLGLAEEFLASRKRQVPPPPKQEFPPKPEQEKETNQATERSNMDKIYEQMEILERLRALELERRAALAEELLREYLEEFCSSAAYSIHREGNVVSVELFGETRSFEFTSVRLGSFPLGEDEELVRERRRREVMEFVEPMAVRMAQDCRDYSDAVSEGSEQKEVEPIERGQGDGKEEPEMNQ